MKPVWLFTKVQRNLPMSSEVRRLRMAHRLLFVATILSAILAGITVDRYFIQRPAFEHVGMVAWGEYSRHADLSRGGLSPAATLNSPTRGQVKIPHLTAAGAVGVYAL
jgi:hypothetical protein